MRTTIRRWKACAICGESFEYKRANALTCSDRCRQDLRRRNGKLPKLPGDDHRVLFHPRSLAVADLALERGVPLAQLILSEDEFDVLVAGSTRFDFGMRQDSAAHLAQKFGWAKAGEDDDLDLELAILDVLASAWKPTTTFGTRLLHRNTPKVARYIPADERWEIVLLDFLPRELEKRRVMQSDPLWGAASLDAGLKNAGGEVVKSADDNPASLYDFVGGLDPGLAELLEEDPSLSDGRAKRQNRESRFVRRGPPQTLAGATDAYKEALKLKLASGKLSNPDLDYWTMYWIHMEVVEGWKPEVSGLDIEEQPWRSHPDREQARTEAHQRKVKKMELATVAAQNEEILAKIEHLRAMQAEIMEKVAETVERVRERFPDSAEVSAAVDEFLESID